MAALRRSPTAIIDALVIANGSVTLIRDMVGALSDVCPDDVVFHRYRLRSCECLSHVTVEVNRGAAS